MNKFNQSVIAFAVKQLDVIKAQYIILLPDGTEFTSTEPKPEAVPERATAPKPQKGEKRRHGKLFYKRGTLAAVYKPLIDALQPGGTVVIPGKGYRFDSMRSSAAAYCNTKWGNGTYITIRSGRSDVQITRHALNEN